MSGHVESVPSVVDRIKHTMVGLKMPRAIEILDATVRRLEPGELTALEAIASVVTLTLVSHGRLLPGFRPQIWSSLGRVSVSDQPRQPLARAVLIEICSIFLIGADSQVRADL